ncbi:MAG: acylphosphatase [Burkholderiaceae bacterium]
MKAVHLFIHGRVQGVGFRDALRARAQTLGLAGWVRNRSDGSVEAVILGLAAATDPLLDWVRRGPPLATVTEVFERIATEQELVSATAPLRRLPTL